MRFYLPFGDWSADGHGQSDKVLIEAPSMLQVLDAQRDIMEQYGEDFFKGYANKYEEPTLSRKVWQALVDEGYPIERFQKYEEINDWSGFSSLEAALTADPNPYVSLDFVTDSFIWLLNQHSAEIRVIDDDIITICNWTCPGFQTVGYGCY